MAPEKSTRPQRDPNVAALLTWLVPGAGHAYTGRTRTALILFVVVEGLFALGLLLSGGRTFEFLDPELRGRFAVILTPEVGNLGGLIYQMNSFGWGALEPSPWPAGILWGSLLCAASGLLNTFAMVSAHLAAGEDHLKHGPARVGRHPAVLVAAAWLVPGLGHWLQGRRARAVVVFCLLVGLFLWGTWLAEGSNLSRERHFYYWSGQFLVGLPAVLAEYVGGRPAVTHEIRNVDVGLLFACMAGLLNVLAMLDVYGVAERTWLGLAEDGKETGRKAPDTAGLGRETSGETGGAS